MVISKRWSIYRDNNIENARFVKEKLLEDVWWVKVDYIFIFIELIMRC